MKLEQSAIFEKFIHIIDQIPFNRILGLKLKSIESDHIIVSFEMKNELVGNFLHGILHGGVISSVIDMAGGIVAMAAVIQKKSDHTIEQLAKTLGKASTISLHVDYLQPGKGEHFTAKAWALHQGNKIIFTRVEMYNQDTSLIAAGTATYLVG